MNFFTVRWSWILARCSQDQARPKKFYFPRTQRVRIYRQRWTRLLLIFTAIFVLFVCNRRFGICNQFLMLFLRGKFDGRDAAVKRILPECFSFADREVWWCSFEIHFLAFSSLRFYFTVLNDRWIFLGWSATRIGWTPECYSIFLHGMYQWCIYEGKYKVVRVSSWRCTGISFPFTILHLATL